MMLRPHRPDPRPTSPLALRSKARPGRIAWCVLALFAAGGCSSASSSERDSRSLAELRELVRNGHFEEAVLRADELAARHAGEPAYEKARKDSVVALMLERARRLSFDGQDEAALEHAEAALDLDPLSGEAEAWRQPIVDKLSALWFLRGRDGHAAGTYVAAAEAYHKSLEYDPENKLAASQLAELEKMVGWRKDQSSTYYNGGVRAFVGARLPESRAGFEASRKYDDGDAARAERRLVEVRREQALGQLHLANQQALEGYWRSAHRTIELAMELDPELEGGEELRERYGVEADVRDLRQTANLARLRDDFERARKLLTEARELSQAQLEKIDAELLEVDDAEALRQYELALDLEYDFRFEQAVAAYRVLLTNREFYKDARARIGTLEDAIVDAAALYSRAEAATSNEQRIELFRQIELIWPEYRDVRERLAALRAER
jgi:tetratricopeptide (TPR) repeat protein